MIEIEQEYFKKYPPRKCVTNEDKELMNIHKKSRRKLRNFYYTRYGLYYIKYFIYSGLIIHYEDK